VSQLLPLAEDGTLDLVGEARRQLNVCNACRYCEGYCAVWPALERRRELTDGDLTHLANLCHDCRDCLDACMYAAPHPFDLNPPAVFSELRVAGLQPGRAAAPTASRRRVRTGLALAAAAVAFIVIAGIDRGFSSLWESHHGAASPYSVIAYVVLLIAMGVPFLWGVGEILAGAARHWRATRSPLRAGGPSAVAVAAVRALSDAATLRNLSGGGAGCTYPDEEPSRGRKSLHHLVAYGFMLCVASTVSAAILQDFLAQDPPYRFVSVPVLLGTVGGAGMVAGCLGLAWLKARSRREAIAPAMVVRDHAFIAALGALAVTGLLVLVLRGTPAFGIILVIHLGIVATCFVIAPYTKFTHGVTRYLALVQDRMESVR
jgi:citrate/tricarballylate utilization protein